MPELYWFLLGCAATATTVLAWSTRTRREHRRNAGEPTTSRAAAPAIEPVEEPAPEPVEPAPPPVPIVKRTYLVGESRSLEDLSAALATELATLASGIEGHAQLICETVGPESDRLWESVRRLRIFAEKMQSFARVPQLEMVPTDIRLLLSAMARELEEYSVGSLQVSLQMAPSLPLAMCNPTALHTAALFMIEGVLMLEPDASNLLIQAQSEDSESDELQVRVDIEAVLDEGASPAIRAVPAIQFSYIAARNLLKAQGAEFTLDHSPGLNAVAGISLQATHAPGLAPAPDEPAVAVATPVPHAEPTGGNDGPHRFGGILIMEGDPAIRDMLARELSCTHRNVIACADGVAARTLFEATPERFELLILEQDSRRLRGNDLAMQALRHDPQLKIILITAGLGASIGSELSPHPNVLVLSKPFGIMELRDCVATSLGPEPSVDPWAGTPSL